MWRRKQQVAGEQKPGGWGETKGANARGGGKQQRTLRHSICRADKRLDRRDGDGRTGETKGWENREGYDIQKESGEADGPTKGGIVSWYSIPEGCVERSGLGEEGAGVRGNGLGDKKTAEKLFDKDCSGSKCIPNIVISFFKCRNEPVEGYHMSIEVRDTKEQ